MVTPDKKFLELKIVKIDQIRHLQIEIGEFLYRHDRRLFSLQNFSDTTQMSINPDKSETMTLGRGRAFRMDSLVIRAMNDTLGH